MVTPLLEQRIIFLIGGPSEQEGSGQAPSDSSSRLLIGSTSDRFPDWQGNLFVGGMMTGRVPQTGHLERIVLNQYGEEVRREWLLAELKQRIRDVRQGPDGLLYVLTEENEAALLRIEPVTSQPPAL